MRVVLVVLQLSGNSVIRSRKKMNHLTVYIPFISFITRTELQEQ